MSNSTPKFGALVEYWDDESGATWAVLGPFTNHEEAREAGDKAESEGRAEYMRGVVPILPASQFH